MRGAGAALVAVAGAIAVGSLPAAAQADQADPCPNAAIRAQQGSHNLPDCRAWERVSPAAKGGADINGGATSGDVIVAEDGDSVLFNSFAAFGDAVAGGFPTVYRARRDGGRWETSSITPPSNAGGITPFLAPFILGFSTDLTRTFAWSSAGLAPGANPDGWHYNLYLQDHRDGERTLLTPDVVPEGPSVPNIFARQPVPYGWSDDLSHVFFHTTFALTPEAPDDGSVKLYERVGGQTSLAGVLPDDSPAQGILPPGRTSARRVVSSDGSRVYFPAGNYVYFREDGQTHRLSDVEIAEPGAERFLTATPDGRYALFIRVSDGEADQLRRFDAVTKTSEVLAHDAVDVLRASDDLSRIYFIGPGATPTLYLWREGVVHDVAVLNSLDDYPDYHDYLHDPYASTSSSVSPDGDTLVFLNDDDEGVLQVYRYEAGGEPECISCPPESATNRPADLSGSYEVLGPFAEIPPSGQFGIGSPVFLAPWRNVGSESRPVFFQTASALVPHDTNGKIDVYQWQNGRVALLSRGTLGLPEDGGNSDARFAGASADGDSVFIVTRQRLVAGDVDDLEDLYVARVGGGVAEQAVPQECAGDACQGSASGPPRGTAPGSASFAGVGDRRTPARRIAAPRVSVTGTAPGPRATLRVRVFAKGRIVVSGPGLKAASRSAPRAGVYRLQVRLARDARRRLATRRRVRLRTVVRFVPASGSARSVRLRLTFQASDQGRRTR